MERIEPWPSTPRRLPGAWRIACALLLTLSIATPREALAASATAWAERLRTEKDAIALSGVEFKGLSIQLTPASDAVLKPLARALRAHPETRLRIEAHVDSTDPVPVPLSQRRADAVAARLKALGAPASTLVESKGMGGAHPLFPSLVESMKAKNRRVAILVRVPPAAPRPAPVAAAPRSVATPAPTPPRSVATPPPAPAMLRAPRVVVVASGGLERRLGGARAAIAGTGARVVQTAQVQESRAFTCVYHTKEQGRQAQMLARVLQSPGIRLVPVGAILPDADVMVVLGGDLR